MKIKQMILTAVIASTLATSALHTTWLEDLNERAQKNQIDGLQELVKTTYKNYQEKKTILNEGKFSPQGLVSATRDVAQALVKYNQMKEQLDAAIEARHRYKAIQQSLKGKQEEK